MEGVLFFLIVFGSITLWKHMGHRHRERMLALQRERTAASAEASALAAATEERLRHLESIVCNVDFELNSKLSRLASHQPVALPPAAAGGSTSSVAARRQPTPAGPATSLASGQRVAGRFVIGRRLGSGSGAVYLARDDSLGESVVLRVIEGLGLSSERAIERLRADLVAIRRVSHANVVSVFDVGEVDGRLLLAMAFVAGTTLDAYLTANGALPLTVARDVVDQLAAGLDAAHAAGVVHGGLTPSGVVLKQQGTRLSPVIVDLGLAHAPRRQGLAAGGASAAYRAPERFDGDEPSVAGDVYALAAVAYHCVTGRAPFEGPTPIAVSLAASTGSPQPAEQLRPDLPAAWSAWFAQAMTKAPDERFTSIRAARDALPAS